MTLYEYVTKEQSKGNPVSYSSIAREVPCKAHYISMIAMGKRRPSYDMAKRIEMVTDGEVPVTNWYENEPSENTFHP